MPVFGVDASGIDVDQIGKNLHIDAVLKDGDSTADVTIKTDSGEKKIENYALKVDWSRRLRSLSASWSRAQTGFRLGVLSESYLLLKCCNLAVLVTIHNGKTNHYILQ